MRSSEYLPLVAALPICAAILAGMTVGNGALTVGGAVAAFVAGLLWPPAGLAVLAVMVPLKSPAVIPAPGFNSVLVGAILLGCVYRLPIDRPSLRPSLPLLLMLAFVFYIAVQQVPDALAGYTGPDSRRIGYLFIQLATLAGVALAAASVLRSGSPAPFIAAGLIGGLIAASLAIAVSALPSRGWRTSWTLPMPMPVSWGRSAIPTTSACSWPRRSWPAWRRSWSPGPGRRASCWLPWRSSWRSPSPSRSREAPSWRSLRASSPLRSRGVGEPGSWQSVPS